MRAGHYTTICSLTDLAVVLVLMTVVLVTFQGTEIVGLAAAESQNPDVSVPRACRSVTYRIVGLYLVPIHHRNA